MHVAYRPVGATIAVSVGTGLTPTQSRVSAVMEAIEAWHAENLRPGTVVAVAGRRPRPSVRRPRPAPRPNGRRSPTALVLDWVAGRGLLTGAPVPVPLDTIRLDFTIRRDWARALFPPTSNGLATGNTLPRRPCTRSGAHRAGLHRPYSDPARRPHLRRPGDRHDSTAR